MRTDYSVASRPCRRIGTTIHTQTDTYYTYKVQVIVCPGIERPESGVQHENHI
jgi:hypothetical protein